MPSLVRVGFLLVLTIVSSAVSSWAGEGGISSSTGDADFSVSFRYPPTPQQIADVKAAIDLMAFGMCDATEGQIRVHRVKLLQGQASEDLADYWLHADAFRSGVSASADGSNLGRLGAHVNLDRWATSAPDVWLHEWGHHAFGLGEQYDEQDRFQGCGIGPGFELGTIDERNHSIMQQTGGTRCVGGANDGLRCLRDSGCPAASGGTPGSCRPVLMSELSVSANHDPIRGTGSTCPIAVQLNRVTFGGFVMRSLAIQTFDPTSFETADATAASRLDVDFVDAGSTNREQKLTFYLTHSGAAQWQVSAVLDGKILSKDDGSLQLIKQWTLVFNPDGSLSSVDESSPSLVVAGLASGAPSVNVALNFGTPNPSGVAGGGRDGLVETALLATPTATSNETRPLCPDAGWCSTYWNESRNRYETSQQSEFHNGKSDWETVVENYSFLSLPSGMPQETAPAKCFRPVEYVENVIGSDQVLLVLDRSGSMAWSSANNVQEICGNSVDDNGDGNIDEAACGDPRIDFVKAAANAYLDLQRDEAIDVGIMSFNGAAVLDRPIGPLNSTDISEFKSIVNGMSPGGTTGIGDALDASNAEFSRVAALGRSRTAYLMTDGYNTSGVSPEDASARLRDQGVRVHVIPAGTDVKDVELGTIASTTGGAVVLAQSTMDLAAIFAELAGRHQGAALALTRTNFTLDESNSGRASLFVEKNAKALTAFISGRNPRMSTWKANLELRGPNGERFGPGSPNITVNSHYVFINVPNPAPGEWILLMSAAAPGIQEVTAVAFIKNQDPDFFFDARPRVVSGARTIGLSASPIFVTQLDGDDVTIKATVIQPTGVRTPTIMNRNNRTGAWSGTAGPFTDNGLYTVEMALDVGAKAHLMRGESIYPGTPVPPVTVVPFQRFATTSFVVINGKEYPCLGRNKLDCDSDGVLDQRECPNMALDIDGDGRLNGRDPDADGDEIPDVVEGQADSDHDGIPDMCKAGPYRLVVPANVKWVDTYITLRAGEPLSISAKGVWSNAGPPSRGPKGFENFKYPGTVLATADLASLIARVGDTVFFVGEEFVSKSPADGRLYLSINDTPDTFGDNRGALNVRITTK